MYLCVCRAIREREVDAAVRAGARRPVDVFRACGKSPQCGGCAPELRKRAGTEITVKARAGKSTPPDPTWGKYTADSPASPTELLQAPTLLAAD